VGDENLANFLVMLAIDEKLLARYAAAKTDDEKRAIMQEQGLSAEAIVAVLNDDDVKLRELADINQNNQANAVNQNNQNNN
jgi:hypothetical protein